MAEPRDLVIRTGASTHEARVGPDGAVDVDGRRVAVEVSAADASTFVVTVGPVRHAVQVVVDGERAWAMAAGETFEVERAAGGRASEPPAAHAGGRGAAVRHPPDDAALSAAMPATVTAVLVRTGQRVAAGAPLARLEAMKMELVVRAPRAGRIAAVDCREGDLVQPGRPLVTLANDSGGGRPDDGRS